MGKKWKRNWLLTIRPEKALNAKLEEEKRLESLRMDLEIERINKKPPVKVKVAEDLTEWDKNMTKPQLLKVVENLGLELLGGETKKDLIKMLQKHDRKKSKRDLKVEIERVEELGKSETEVDKKSQDPKKKK